MVAGFDNARGKFIVTMDGDLQNDPTDIPFDATIAISGSVEDTNGASLVGATVTAFQPDEIAVTYQALSGTGGAYMISLPTGAPNSGYTVVAELAGFVSVNQTDQAVGTVNFTGSNGLQAKTTITSVTAWWAMSVSGSIISRPLAQAWRSR